MEQKIDLSFVDTSVMNTTDSINFDAEVANAMKEKKAYKDGSMRYVLKDLDFSNVDYTKVHHKDFTGWVIENVIFSRSILSSSSRDTAKHRVRYWYPLSRVSWLRYSK